LVGGMRQFFLYSFGADVILSFHLSLPWRHPHLFYCEFCDVENKSGFLLNSVNCLIFYFFCVMEKNNNITELVFIIDKSGSMSGLEGDTIGGFNSMLNQHRKGEGKCHISTIMFSDHQQVIHNRKNISDVSPLTDNDYIPGGCTALLDALGNAINHTIQVQRLAADDERASKVIFVIITDGYENSSREYSAPQIRSLIKKEQEKYGWEFIFLGANIDSVATAGSYGIRADRSVDFVCDSQGIGKNFEAIGSYVSACRSCCCESETAFESSFGKVRKDYESRSGR